MSLTTATDTNNFWIKLEGLQAEADDCYQNAHKTRDLDKLVTILPVFRKMYWAGSLLGQVDFSSVCAGAAVLISQIRDSNAQWSLDSVKDMRTILNYTRTHINSNTQTAKKESSSDAVENLIQAEGKTESSAMDHLRSIFRRKNISFEELSLCHRFSPMQNASSRHTIAVPPFAQKRHNQNRRLVLVGLKIKDQSIDFEKLFTHLEDSVVGKEILLHGPLSMPSSEIKTQSDNTIYLMLLDILEDEKTWLKKKNLKGSLVKLLKSPVQVEQPGTKNLKEKAKVTSNTENQSVESINNEESPATVNQEAKLRITVGSKLILIVSSIIIFAMTALSLVSLYIFRTELRNRIEYTNISLSSIVAQQVENEIIQLFNSANLLLKEINTFGKQSQIIDDFFTTFSSILYVGIPDTEFSYFNSQWFQKRNLFNESTIINSILDLRSDELQLARSGETIIINTSPMIPNSQNPVLAMAAPLQLNNKKEYMVILVDVSESLAESVNVQEGFATTMIINSKGDILAHKDLSRVFSGENLKGSPIYSSMYSMGTQSGQIRFIEEAEEGQKVIIGSFTLIPIGNLGIISTIFEHDAFSVINRIQFLTISLLGFILSLAILGILLFSNTISRPLKDLTLATRQIKSRNFDIDIKPKTHDEVGLLTQNFISMIPELEKVDRLQERTSKFVNPQVARMIAEGSLPNKARIKEVTVFFSDIRNYTSMSEAMGDPQIVLDNLTEYLQIMVPCILDTQGTVDKFIGDAIMAVWGSMQDLPNNAENAVNGALMMRTALKKFNLNRGTVNQPIFQIGCGMNSGPVTVGLMGGGTAKEEWAHIGDAVNLASRIESLNKKMGTDILISQSTAEKVEGIFDLVPLNMVNFKGKKEAQQIYAVLGRLDDNSRPRSINELRKTIGINRYSQYPTV